MMPEMNGVEVCRRARARVTDQPPYIIILTVKDEKADIVAGLEAGANDYLAKPFDPEELRARVEVGRRMVEMQTRLTEHALEPQDALREQEKLTIKLRDALLMSKP